MSFWSETTQPSRKVRTCDECGCKIGIGDIYSRGVGVNHEGDFNVWITHPDCLAATLEQRALAGLDYYDDWWPLSEWTWEMPADALAVFAADYPAAYARAAPNLIAHGRIAVVPAAQPQADEPS